MARVAPLLVLLAAIASGCISGRILRGYPGYPFAHFTAGVPADSAFFELQAALVQEGYPLDYTRREAGLINTQAGPDSTRPLTLSVIVAPVAERPARTEVWVAGYEETRSGPRRVNPLDESLWAELMAVSARLSERLEGSPPTGPDERRTRPDAAGAGS